MATTERTDDSSTALAHPTNTSMTILPPFRFLTNPLQLSLVPFLLEDAVVHAVEEFLFIDVATVNRTPHPYPSFFAFSTSSLIPAASLNLSQSYDDLSIVLMDFFASRDFTSVSSVPVLAFVSSSLHVTPSGIRYSIFSPANFTTFVFVVLVLVWFSSLIAESIERLSSSASVSCLVSSFWDWSKSPKYFTASFSVVVIPLNP